MIFSEIFPPAPDGAGTATDHQEDEDRAHNEDQNYKQDDQGSCIVET